MILLISASRVAGITDVSHGTWHYAVLYTDIMYFSIQPHRSLSLSSPTRLPKLCHSYIHKHSCQMTSNSAPEYVPKRTENRLLNPCIYRHVQSSTVLVSGPNQKWPKSPKLMNKWTKVVIIHERETEYYLMWKRNGVPVHVITRTNLETITGSERKLKSLQSAWFHSEKTSAQANQGHGKETTGHQRLGRGKRPQCDCMKCHWIVPFEKWLMLTFMLPGCYLH
jgi:hypothetical protein